MTALKEKEIIGGKLAKVQGEFERADAALKSWQEIVTEKEEKIKANRNEITSMSVDNPEAY